MPTIFDNIDTPFIENDQGNGLRNALKVSKRGDFCVGYFNLRGWRYIDDVVGEWEVDPTSPFPPCRLLVGMQRVPSEDLTTLFSTQQGDAGVDMRKVVLLRREAATEFKKQLTLGIPSSGDEAGLRRLARQLKEGRLQVKLYLRHTLHAKLYLAHRDDKFTPIIAYVGSSNLTMSGLSGQGELNVDVHDQDASRKLETWFNDRWQDTRCLDISKELVEIIEESWAGERLIPPHHIYLKIAWHLSQDARDGIKEFRVPHDIAGELLPFQLKAVQLACRHLNKRGGVLVGDVVGLGKTRVAASIARVMGDDQMLESLILCPKNLTSMWEDYARQFGLRAPRVLSQSQAITELPKLPRYRLVVIDESHNFRNREGKTYQAIRDYVERNDCKMVLLSATPYNKTFLDLGNQLRLFLPEQSDLGVRPEAMLRSVGEEKFSLENPNVPLTSLAAFEKSSEADDWREVMRLFLVRRTRSFIIQNYAETDEVSGRKFLSVSEGIRAYFPARVPRTVQFRSDSEDLGDKCARLLRPEVVTLIENLSLPRYGLSGYVKPSLPADLSAAERKVIDDLSRAGRRLMGFCKTNLFKRLESSGQAFLLSVHRHILRNYIFLHALETGKALPIGQPDADTLDTRFRDQGDGEVIFSDEGEEASEETVDFTECPIWEAGDYKRQAAQLYGLFESTQKRRFRWINSAVFQKTLAKALKEDANALHGLIKQIGAIEPSADHKLQALVDLVRDQYPREKFLIFTQFADTAEYLWAQLKTAGVDSVDCVTGQSIDPSRQAWRFSPDSNGKIGEFPPGKQTRVLIATDVLSEGQNLQDANRVINYDLPWAIIRLVQRAGRVDRIGQKADTITCYSFLPADGIENIIRLRERLQNRLRENAEVVGSDETFFENQTPDANNALRKLYSEDSGILDEPEDDEVDLTSEAYEIWAQAVKSDPSLKKTIENLPDVVFSTKAHVPDPQHPHQTPPGVLTYIRTKHDNDALIWIDSGGKAVSESPVRILRAAACPPSEQALTRREDHHALVMAAAKVVFDERRDLQAGQLGSRRGARYRTYDKLQDFLRRNEGDLLLNESVRSAVQAIYDHPLTTEAVDKLNRQLRSGISDDELASLVATLHRDDRLVVANLHDTELKNARILCSLGLRERDAPRPSPISVREPPTLF